MSKKKKFQLGDLKDKKFIFPVIIVFLVIIIGWFVFEIVAEVQQTSSKKDEGIEVSEIQSIPIGEGKDISSKAEAMQEAFREQEDYTAIQGLYDPTLIDSDTTIYSAEEIAYLDSLERVALMGQAEIEALNEEILRSNQELSESRRGVSDIGYDYGYGSTDQATSTSNDELLQEMMLYQKLINGEEILTPEQEAQRKEEQIRLEERQRIYEELNASETIVLEKVEAHNKATFNTVSVKKRDHKISRNIFKAMVDQTTKVEQGSRIRLALLEDVKLANHIIRSGTHIYGTVSGFTEQRILVEVSSILVDDHHLKVDLAVLDVDGLQGLYVPKSAFRDVSKAAAAQAVQGGQMSINTSPDNFVGMAAQAVQNAYQSVSQALSSNISKNKATIKYNTIVYLTNKQ